MKSKNHLFVIFAAVGAIAGLMACGLGAPAPTATPLPPTETPVPSTPTPVPPTPTATVTPTQTPFPLSDIDLAPLLVQGDELPAGFGTLDATYEISLPFVEDLPKADRAVEQRFDKNGPAGYVVVLLYKDEADIQKAYDDLLSQIFGETESYPDIGEKSAGMLDATIRVSEVTFIRCHAVVSIYFSGYTTSVKWYAKQLDQRLADVVCEK